MNENGNGCVSNICQKWRHIQVPILIIKIKAGVLMCSVRAFALAHAHVRAIERTVLMQINPSAGTLSLDMI